MAIDLNKPLRWQSASHEEQQLLRALQGNILKGHGRPEATHLFFQFVAKHALRTRRVLRELGNYDVTCAYTQLLESERHRACGQPGSAFVALFLSHTGYQAIAAQAPAGEPAFVKGMKNPANMKKVGDPTPVSRHWERGFRDRIDAMVLVADDNPDRLRRQRDRVVGLFADAHACLLHEQAGAVLRDKHGNSIEHFGYVDGRSQPLMLVEDIEREARGAGIDRWDPQVPLGQALVPDLPDGISFGSYFVFRKLEQDVRGFKRQEQVLADVLALHGDDRERAGALIVGRFEDGTPATLSATARGLKPPNDFDYAGDAATRCPMQAHIRKVNPRGSSAGGAGKERKRLMPRRGIPYEDRRRDVHPVDVPVSTSLAEFDAQLAPLLPTDGVGLLFMAYNASLSQQFVFTQARWANDADFPASAVGIDPVIGQGHTARAPAQSWPAVWDDPASATCQLDIHGHVHMRGGEYFFAPSLGFLKSL